MKNQMIDMQKDWKILHDHQTDQNLDKTIDPVRIHSSLHNVRALRRGPNHRFEMNEPRCVI